MLLKLLKRFLHRAPREPAVAGASVAHAEELARAGRLNDAVACYRAMLGADPSSLKAQVGLANTLVDLWRLDEALQAYERALALSPQSGTIRSAVLFYRHYVEEPDPRQLFEAHLRLGAAWMAGSAAAAPAPPGPRPDGRLRIGYVSPNLSRHSVGYFIEPVLRHHDRQRFEVFCYYTHRKSDETTARLRTLADGWRDVPEIHGEALAAKIRDDGIDVLVDLAGHSKGNRMSTFACRPAPLQVTWLGYADTTGLPSMDLRITDAIADPAPRADQLNSERLARIDGGFLCYQPPVDAPAVGAQVNPPSDVVFASFNNIAKLNAPTVRTWSAILAALPGSRLLLKSALLDFAETADRVLEQFERCGVATERVEFHGWAAGREHHLAMYQGVDVALDTWPYNGTTTTCEALWMGVPVVTRAGNLHMSRVGASLLDAAGLPELVATSAQHYIDIAIALANDAARRRELRDGLRAQLGASTLLDHAGFTRRLERVYLEGVAGK